PITRSAGILIRARRENLIPEVRAPADDARERILRQRSGHRRGLPRRRRAPALTRGGTGAQPAAGRAHGRRSSGWKNRACATPSSRRNACATPRSSGLTAIRRSPCTAIMEALEPFPEASRAVTNRLFAEI